MSIYSYNSDSPDWQSMVRALKNKGVKMSEIAKYIGSTNPHVYMILNGERGSNLSYTTGIRLYRLFVAKCVI